MNGDEVLFTAIPLLVLAGFGLTVLAFTLLVWWRIISRTGYSGWLSILMFIPLANIVLFLILAFAEWPIHRELEDLRRRAAAPPVA